MTDRSEQEVEHQSELEGEEERSLCSKNQCAVVIG